MQSWYNAMSSTYKTYVFKCARKSTNRLLNHLLLFLKVKEIAYTKSIRKQLSQLLVPTSCLRIPSIFHLQHNKLFGYNFNRNSKSSTGKSLFKHA